MSTKIIKAWINGAIQEIEVEDIVLPDMEPSVEERVGVLEEKHEVVITDGNLLVGNGTTELEEMTPDEVLSHINGASVVTMTTAEYEAMGEDESNANTLYVLTDSEESGGSIEVDPTLSVEGKAADAKAVGDALATMNYISASDDGTGIITFAASPLTSSEEAEF